MPHHFASYDMFTKVRLVMSPKRNGREVFFFYMPRPRRHLAHKHGEGRWRSMPHPRSHHHQHSRHHCCASLCWRFLLLELFLWFTCLPAMGLIWMWCWCSGWTGHLFDHIPYWSVRHGWCVNHRLNVSLDHRHWCIWSLWACTHNFVNFRAFIVIWWYKLHLCN